MNDKLYGWFTVVVVAVGVLALPTCVVIGAVLLGPDIGGVIGYIAGGFAGLVFWMVGALFAIVGS